MSPRQPGVDEAGRPIVAELGRAETPDEIADRRAASSSAHRANQTLINLLLAIGASLVIVVVLVLLVVRPDAGSNAPKVDYRQTAQQAEQTVSQNLAAPTLPSGWYANRAELDTPSNQVASWGIGFVTPASHYIGLTQGFKADETWTADQVGKQDQTRTIRLDGVSWDVYDHRDTGGQPAYALVGQFADTTVVLSGTTATPAEFATLATAVAKELS